MPKIISLTEGTLRVLLDRHGVADDEFLSLSSHQKFYRDALQVLRLTDHYAWVSQKTALRSLQWWKSQSIDLMALKVWFRSPKNISFCVIPQSGSLSRQNL